MRWILLVAFASIAIVSGVALWVFHDANRFKPALIAYAERELQTSIEMRGELEWQLRPALGLSASGLRAVHQGRTWTADRLVLRPALASLIGNPTTFAEWRIAGVEIDNLGLATAGGHLRAPRLKLRDVGLGTAVPFEASLVYDPDSRAAVGVELQGALTLTAERLRIGDMAFVLPNAEGICTLEILTPPATLLSALSAGQPALPERDAVLPLAFMRTHDWDGRCDVHRLWLADQVVENAHVVLDNKEGSSIVSARAPSALGGEAQLQVVVHAGETPVVWEIEPYLANVDSQRLGKAFAVESPIAAPLDLSGSIGMVGDTANDLAATLDADIRFATGAGTINADWITTRLAQIADQLNVSASASTTGEPVPPAIFSYERLVGTWRGTGEHNRLNLALDSLNLEVEGTYHFPKDQLSLLGVVTIGESAQRWGLPLPASVAALPFHFRCGGGLGRPNCRLDAGRTLLGKAVDRGRVKADEFVDSFVPEEYRERARSFLDHLESGAEAALRAAPDAAIDEQAPESHGDPARSLLELLQGALEQSDQAD